MLFGCSSGAETPNLHHEAAAAAETGGPPARPPARPPVASSSVRCRRRGAPMHYPTNLSTARQGSGGGERRDEPSRFPSQTQEGRRGRVNRTQQTRPRPRGETSEKTEMLRWCLSRLPALLPSPSYRGRKKKKRSRTPHSPSRAIHCRVAASGVEPARPTPIPSRTACVASTPRRWEERSWRGRVLGENMHPSLHGRGGVRTRA